MDKEFSIDGPMISGIGEQAERIYKKIKGKRGNWYIALQENAADNIYHGYSDGTYSEGFGGRTLTFKLEDGTEDKVQGPWHSNDDSLFSDTGYDIRDKHLTRGIISKGKEGNFYKEVYKDVVYYDEKPVLGEFDRIPKMAQKLANELNCELYYSVKTSGGGSSFFVKPENLS